MDETRARARFESALADYRQEFETFFLARLLDLGFEYEEELCRVRFPVEEFLFNPQGSLHGGAIATVMDISMGHLLKHMTGTGGATLEMKVQYLRPLTSGTACCEGRVLRRGRSLCFLESRLFDENGKLAAVATSTWKLPSAG
ncbi:PaaI family thioesterase [Nisaea acidiphila]|uniref:PaaI family thioesterase n=1 Tax=Nisaea acidiphila TaxID=1862145 RepID=A0A9J7AW40_9PROT|nr:PaaI family thioesterase [Nisaea acidiphila]UUX50665.1 PaaI family thioesterase [Nisaea acidiphila]